MENIGRRNLLQLLFAGAAVAALGNVVTRAEAAGLAVKDGALPPVGEGASGVVEASEAAMEPTQAIVIRPRRGRIIVRPRRRRRVCRRTPRGLVCNTY